jgi:peptidoglycan hydrolase CwlO-like protein
VLAEEKVELQEQHKIEIYKKEEERNELQEQVSELNCEIESLNEQIQKDYMSQIEFKEQIKSLT